MGMDSGQFPVSSDSGKCVPPELHLSGIAIITPCACARGKVIPSVRRLSVCLSVCLSSAKNFLNILQADTSSTYDHVISFANSTILTFVYLIIRNTLQFSVHSGLSYYPVQLVVHLEIPYIEL